MATACWAARCSSVGSEDLVVSDRWAKWDGFQEELVDIVVGTVCFEDHDSLEGR